MAASAGPEIERLIGLLSKLPGLGPRSARRAALALMKRRDQLLGPLTEALADARDRVKTCSTCGTLDTTGVNGGGRLFVRPPLAGRHRKGVDRAGQPLLQDPLHV